MITAKFYSYEYGGSLWHKEEEFESLDALSDWMFDKMACDYSDKKHEYCLGFWMIDRYDDLMNGIKCPFKADEFPLQFNCITEDDDFYLGLITKDNGKIIFSDGKFTSGKKHWSNEVKEWMRRCRKRQKNPVFEFED